MEKQTAKDISLKGLKVSFTLEVEGLELNLNNKTSEELEKLKEAVDDINDRLSSAAQMVKEHVEKAQANLKKIEDGKQPIANS